MLLASGQRVARRRGFVKWRVLGKSKVVKTIENRLKNMGNPLLLRLVLGAVLLHLRKTAFRGIFP